MFWNPNQDELIYDFTKVLEGVEVQPATRRLILRTATRFFDPLGLICESNLNWKIHCDDHSSFSSITAVQI